MWFNEKPRAPKARWEVRTEVCFLPEYPHQTHRCQWVLFDTIYGEQGKPVDSGIVDSDTRDDAEQCGYEMAKQAAHKIERVEAGTSVKRFRF